MKNFIIFLKLALGALGGWAGDSQFDVSQVCVNHASTELVSKLKQFESSFAYPFSDTEEFTIQHGMDGDYFAFFKQLGKPYYFIATCNQSKTLIKTVDGNKTVIQQTAGEIAAAGSCVLRTMKTRTGKLVPAWYICDLKVDKKYQGEHIPLKIAEKVAFARFLQCPRGFGICMNPPDGKPKAAGIFKKHGPIPGLQTNVLNLYTLNAQQIQKHRTYLEGILMKRGYMKAYEQLVITSTVGAKDYLICNTSDQASRPWLLFHLRPSISNGLDLHEDGTYMICAVEGTLLDADFRKVLGMPSSTAQIVSYGMKDVDFNFLTSNQI